MKPMRVDYTEVPHNDHNDEENLSSSSTRMQEEMVKSLFPSLRSYLFRRQLSFAGVVTMVVAVGAAVILLMEKANSNHGESKRISQS